MSNIDYRIAYVKEVIKTKVYHRDGDSKFNWMMDRSWNIHLEDLIKEKKKASE